MRLYAAALPLFLLAMGPSACPPSPPAPAPPPPPVLDAGPPPTCDMLCKHLGDLQCPEGQKPDCVEACVKLSAIADAHVACGTAARDQNAARLCGFRCNTGPAAHLGATSGSLTRVESVFPVFSRPAALLPRLAYRSYGGIGACVGVGDVFLPSPSCSSPPADLTGGSLKAYAASCGPEAARKIVLEETGIDPTLYLEAGKDLASGKVDWDKVGVAIAKSEFGSGFDTSIIGSDGALRWDVVVKDAGAVAAVAVCTAYGAGALSPVCGAIGGLVGGELVKLGEALAEAGKGFAQDLGLIDSSAPPCSAFPASPAVGIARSWTATMPDVVRNELSISGYAAIVANVANLLATAETRAGRPTSWTAMLGALKKNGLVAPDYIWSLYGSDPDWIKPGSKYASHAELHDESDPNRVYLEKFVLFSMVIGQGAAIRQPLYWRGPGADMLSDPKNKGLRFPPPGAPPTGFGAWDKKTFYCLVDDTCGHSYVIGAADNPGACQAAPISLPTMEATVLSSSAAEKAARAAAADQAATRKAWITSLQTAVTKTRAEIRAKARASASAASSAGVWKLLGLAGLLYLGYRYLVAPSGGGGRKGVHR